MADISLMAMERVETLPIFLLKSEKMELSMELSDIRDRPDMMERMASRIPGAGFKIMTGAGHLAPLEQPDEFNQLIETFLSESIVTHEQ